MGVNCSVCSHVTTIPSINKGNPNSGPNKLEIKLLLIGLDNAGKTTTAMHLLGEPLDQITPTVGFSNISMKKYSKFNVEVYDLGGGGKIRGIWSNYFALVHGVIFVVDSSDMNRAEEAKEALRQVLSHEKVAGKPLLVLLNKQDREDSLDEYEICSLLNLNELVNSTRCPTKIESCSAIYTEWNQLKDGRFENVASTNSGGNIRDPALIRGYLWLLRVITNNWSSLNQRVYLETQEQVAAEKDIIQQRIKRINERKQKEKEAEEENDGQDSIPTRDIEDEDPHENPFKPINQVIAANEKNKPRKPPRKSLLKDSNPKDSNHHQNTDSLGESRSTPDNNTGRPPTPFRSDEDDQLIAKEAEEDDQFEDASPRENHTSPSDRKPEEYKKDSLISVTDPQITNHSTGKRTSIFIPSVDGENPHPPLVNLEALQQRSRTGSILGPLPPLPKAPSVVSVPNAASVPPPKLINARRRSLSIVGSNNKVVPWKSTSNSTTDLSLAQASEFESRTRPREPTNTASLTNDEAELQE